MPGDETGHEASAELGAQLEVNCGSDEERRGPIRVGYIFGLRDGLSKPKKKAKASLLKRIFF